LSCSFDYLEKENVQQREILTKLNNLEEDGGFWLVPGFHKYLAQWTSEHQTLRDMYGPYCRFNVFRERDFPELYAAACHISSRAGSAILWDQRVMHGSRANSSLRPRFAQLFKMFPAEHFTMTPERAEHRRNAILTKLSLARINSDVDLSPLGRRLFGLEK
jgi:ectoine hydroxylase-related dioxygenase (phytanoyl-CoA dioxygenase family)